MDKRFNGEFILYDIYSSSLGTHDSLRHREREILAETLNLYIGMVGHRTNQVVNRLTVVSFVFLPLTFLCGVYGMNFEVLPELKWRYGYMLFWVVSTIIVAALLTYMRKRRWW